jgi:selenium metabolism protein YedF
MDQTHSSGASSPVDAGQVRPVILFASNTLGDGNKDLGGILMRSYIKTLAEVSPRPRTLVFVNSGVYLTCEGSELLGELQGLVDGGAAALSCGTCLDFFNLKDKLRVGKVSNMHEIATELSNADRLVRL